MYIDYDRPTREELAAEKAKHCEECGETMTKEVLPFRIEWYCAKCDIIYEV